MLGKFLQYTSRGVRRNAAAHTVRASHYLGENRTLATTIYGKKIYLSTRDLSLTPHILVDGYWEKWISDQLFHLVKPGMKVVEIGANVGYYTLLLADLVGDKGHVTAFEANPQLANTLFHTLHLNGYHDRSTVCNLAVFDKKARLKFHVFDRFQGSSSLFAQVETAKDVRDKLRSITVQANTLDAAFDGEADYLKIDAEGAEPFILRGAERVLQNKNILVQLEFAPAMLNSYPGGASAMLDILQMHGFKTKIFSSDKGLQSISREALLATAHCDILLSRHH